MKIESLSQKKPSRNNRSTQKEKAFRVFGGFSGFVAGLDSMFLRGIKGSRSELPGLGVVIKEWDAITMANPSSVRMEINEAKSGGVFDSRNGTILKICSLIDVGEHAGSGIAISFTYGACNHRAV